MGKYLPQSHYCDIHGNLKQHTCKEGREEVHEHSSPTRAGICFNTFFFNLKHLWVPRKALINSPIRASHLPLVCVTSYTQRISLYVTPPIMKTMILGPVFISVGPLFLCQLPYRALQDVTRENRNMYCSSEINVFFSTSRYLFVCTYLFLCEHAHPHTHLDGALALAETCRWEMYGYCLGSSLSSMASWGLNPSMLLWLTSDTHSQLSPTELSVLYSTLGWERKKCCV